MSAYYNEFDPHAAAWLRELIKAGHIADGDVDERSIIEVTADDVKGYTQQHFFAGIGGWSFAARLAGWPDDKPLFTGSAPCQPFSTAGKQKGIEDSRHLAPHWLELVRAVRPPFVAGEQVAAAVNKDNWLDDLLDALEAEDYATGSIVLPASFVGAPHIRQRSFFVGRLGNSECTGLAGQRRNGNNWHEPGRIDTQQGGSVAETGTACEFCGYEFDLELLGRYGCPNCEGSGLVYAGHSERGGRDAMGSTAGESGSKTEKSKRAGAERIGSLSDDADAGAVSGLGEWKPAANAHQTGWNDPDWIFCRDGKWRPVESGSFPLVDGLPRGMGYVGNPCEPGYASQTAEARVMRLKGYGNAIVPQVAAEVLKELL